MADDKRFIDLTPEQRFTLQLVDRLASVVTFAIKAAVTLGIVFSVVYIVSVFGQYGVKADINVNAHANVVVHLFALLDSEVKWAWGIAVVAALYGLLERELRRRKTAYLQGRITKLEEQIHPGRTSSGLTARGETNRMDQP